MKLRRFILLLIAFAAISFKNGYSEDSFQFNADYAIYKGSDN